MIFAIVAVTLAIFISTLDRNKAKKYVFPDPIKTGTDSWFKKIFNVLTMLVLSPFQPRDIGQGTDADCEALMDRAQRHDPQGIVVKDIYKSSGPKAREPAQRHASRSR